MSTFPPIGRVHQLLAGAIPNAYSAASPSTTLSAAIKATLAKRIRFYARITLDAGSTITSVKMKLRHRFNDGKAALQLGWIDLPSYLDDVQGAAQPKGPTREIEHTFAPAAGQSLDVSFYLDLPEGIPDLAVDMHADQVGHANDSITVYACAA